MNYVVALKCNQFMRCKEAWLSNPRIDAETKVFFSPNFDAVANFNASKKLFFDPNVEAVYDGRVQKIFGKKCDFFYLSVYIV